MKVMVIVKASGESEKGVMPTSGELAEMGRYNQELVEAGIMLDGDGLRPSSGGVRIDYTSEGSTVTDGPFAETKELIRAPGPRRTRLPALSPRRRCRVCPG